MCEQWWCRRRGLRSLSERTWTSNHLKTLNLRKGQRTKQRNRILVDLISKIWDSKNWKTEKLTVRLDWTFIFPFAEYKGSTFSSVILRSWVITSPAQSVQSSKYTVKSVKSYLQRQGKQTYQSSRTLFFPKLKGKRNRNLFITKPVV